jgi:hypothetical protein
MSTNRDKIKKLLKIEKSKPITTNAGTSEERTDWLDAEGYLHREFGPARIWRGGCTEWYSHGKLHRKDGPAIEKTNGDKEYYKFGLRHRSDGPAIDAKSYQAWFLNGARHRVDGPAVIHKMGGLEYWVNHKKHRLDGPAVVRPKGQSEYWVNGKYLSHAEFQELTSQESLADL